MGFVQVFKPRTFPEVLMPLIKHNTTIIQDARRHSAKSHLTPPICSIPGLMSSTYLLRIKDKQSGKAYYRELVNCSRESNLLYGKWRVLFCLLPVLLTRWLAFDWCLICPVQEILVTLPNLSTFWNLSFFTFPSFIWLRQPVLLQDLINEYQENWKYIQI